MRGGMPSAPSDLSPAHGRKYQSHLGTLQDSDCLAKLDRMVERDDDSVRLPGAADALDLLGEERITAALLRHKE
jgi:hypothetical protein